jgi:hypothetical protein
MDFFLHQSALQARGLLHVPRPLLHQKTQGQCFANSEWLLRWGFSQLLDFLHTLPKPALWLLLAH